MLEETNKIVTEETPAEETNKAPAKKSGRKTTAKEKTAAEPVETTEATAEPAEEHHTAKKKSASKSHAAKEPDDTAENAAAEVKPEGERQEKNDIQDIIDKAKAKGSISNSEIMISLGDTDYDLDQIDKLYETLETMGIDITEDYDDEPIDLDEDIEADLENFESPESMEKALSQEGLAIDDPVKMYLKEIGQGAASFGGEGSGAFKAHGGGRRKSQAGAC